MKKSIRLLSYFLFSILLISCMDDMDDVLPENQDMSQASEFIYRGLNYFYLYKSNTPELANDYFSHTSDKESFLSNFENPNDLFHYLKYEGDRFSVLMDDYVDLERALQGRSLSTGAIFLGFTDNDNNYYILVRNVIENSNAELQGVVRGDKFHAINGQTITKENVNELLNAPSIELSYLHEENGTLIPTNETVTLHNSDIDEPSIGMYKILNIDNTKIGYLMYNSFIAEYNEELNEVFRYFKNEGVDELILDLRYNSGGSIYSAELLSNMITGQFKGQVLYENEWNEDLQPYNGEVVKFTDKFRSGETIESLEMSRIAIITQSNTASASELVINALNPYINILQVGMDTRGKYQGSILLYDSPNFNRQYMNPLHRYAMLPLVLKTKNSEGFTDFDEGLPVDIEYQERVKDIKNNLGTVNDILLRKALEGLGINVPEERGTPTIELPTSSLQTISDKMDGIMYIDLQQ